MPPPTRPPRKFTVIIIPPHNEKLHEPVHIGEILYELMKNDYNGAAYDTELLEVKCISVTRDPSGDYPFVTMPLHCMKEEQCQ